MSKLRIGFVGSGYMSGMHAESFLKLPDTEIVAVCGSGKGTGAASFGEKFGCQYFDDYIEMFDTVEMDVVVIAIPPYAHCGQTEYAAQKGIHIFLEKPLALDVERAKSMQKAINDNGVISMVGYHMRFGGAVRKLKKMIEDGSAGKVTMIDATYRANALHSEWWRDVTKSGGQVFEQAIHLYDMAYNFLGKPVSLSAYLNKLCHQDCETYTVEDTAASAILFANGSIGSITSSNCAVPMSWEGSFSVICENVTAIFKDFNNAEFIYTDGGKAEQPKHEVVESDINPYFDEIEAFYNSVLENKPSPITVDDGMVSLCMVDACVRSNGNKIEL